MRPPADYVALHDIKMAGSDYAFAARAGDDMTEAQRQRYAELEQPLVIGLDIMPLRPGDFPEPAKDAGRAEWQDYAVARGVPYGEAVALDLADLRKRPELSGDAPVEPAADTAPDPDARKDAWVAFAIIDMVRNGVPQDEAVDRAGSATKARLVEAFGGNPDPDARAEFLAAPEGQPAG